MVYARDGAILAVPFDVSTLEVRGPPVTVLEGVWMDPIAGNAEMALSHRGDLLYAPGDAVDPSEHLVWVDRNGETELLTESAGRFGNSSLSPDERRLAIWVGGANNSIWIYDIARGTMTRLVSGFENVGPIWTPSGDAVTFASNRSGVDNLYSQVADGSAPPERLTTSELAQYPLSWSPDGQWLAFGESRPETGNDIGLLSVEEGGVARWFAQTSANESSAQFSPDGCFLAYVSDETGRDEVYVQSFPSTGRKWQASTAGGREPRWNPNGRELFYRRGPEILVVDVDTRGELELGNPRVLFEVPNHDGPFGVSADGARLLFIEGRSLARAPTQLVLVQNWAEELKRLAPPD